MNRRVEWATPTPTTTADLVRFAAGSLSPTPDLALAPDLAPDHLATVRVKGKPTCGTVRVKATCESKPLTFLTCS